MLHTLHTARQLLCLFVSDRSLTELHGVRVGSSDLLLVIIARRAVLVTARRAMFRSSSEQLVPLRCQQPHLRFAIHIWGVLNVTLGVVFVSLSQIVIMLGLFLLDL